MGVSAARQSNDLLPDNRHGEGALVTRFSAGAYSIGTQFSTHIFRYVAVPTFDDSGRAHRELAALSQQAHEATSARVREMEEEVDGLAARLWGLTAAKLQEIQKSLEELE